MTRHARNPGVIDFLMTRRSRSARTLGHEPPDAASLDTILTAAARTPDHGMLVPWRFVLIERAAMPRIAEIAHHKALARGLDAGAAEKAAAQFGYGGLIVTVVSSPRPSAKIPVWEQELSAGAVCLSTLNAALALGWGANWLTGPLARDRAFLSEALDLGETETVAGFIHLGPETTGPAERKRPEVSALVTRLGADDQ